MSAPRRVCHVFPYDPRHLGLCFPRWAASQLERWPLAAVCESRWASHSSAHVIGPRARRLPAPPLEVLAHRSLSSGPVWRDWGDDWSPGLGRKLARLEADDVCVIHLNDYPAARLAQLAASRCRVVIVFHGRGLGRFDHHLASAERLVVLRSDAAAALLQSGARHEQVVLLAPSVDRRRFAAVTPDRPDDERPLLGFVGRLERSKGVLELPGVLARLQAQGIAARVELAGSFSADQRDELIEAALTAGVQDGLELLGELPGEELAERMRRWRLLLLPSHTEGHSIVALEACVGRLPVAAVEGVLPAELERRPAIAVAPREDYPALVERLLAEERRPPADDWVRSHKRAAAEWDALLEALPGPGTRAGLPPVSRRRLQPPRRLARRPLRRSG